MVIPDLWINSRFPQNGIIPAMSAHVASITRCTRVTGGGQFRYIINLQWESVLISGTRQRSKHISQELRSSLWWYLLTKHSSPFSVTKWHTVLRSGGLKVRLAQGNCVGEFKGKGSGRVFGNDQRWLRDLRGQREVKQFKNVGLKTKSSLGLDCC